MISDTLIKRAKSKNRRYQKKLFNNLYGYVHAVSTRYLKDTEEAKEVTSSVFYDFFYGEFEANSKNIVSVFKSVASNKCISIISKRNLPSSFKKRDNLKLDDLSVPKNITPDELLSAVVSIDEPNRAVFNMIMLDGFKKEHVSRLFNIDIDDVSKIYEHSKVELSNFLKNNYEKH